MLSRTTPLSVSRRPINAGPAPGGISTNCSASYVALVGLLRPYEQPDGTSGSGDHEDDDDDEENAAHVNPGGW